MGVMDHLITGQAEFEVRLTFLNNRCCKSWSRELEYVGYT